jgi:hypothetical protein
MGETRSLELQLDDRPRRFFPRDLRAPFAPFAVKSFSADHLCNPYIRHQLATESIDRTQYRFSAKIIQHCEPTAGHDELLSPKSEFRAPAVFRQEAIKLLTSQA